MKILDWGLEEDAFLKEKEIFIHNEYHSQLAKRGVDIESVWKSKGPRIKALHTAIKASGATFGGKILEVGAGDAWCSAYMLKNFNSITDLYSMEINDAAVKVLIPQVLESIQNEKANVNVVKGSFNNIIKKNYFDFIIAMGAVHHSGNLYRTMCSMFSALKPGGWLFAQEPYMPNSTPNNFYRTRDEMTINFKNLLEVKNSERTDVMYRECEYRTAAFHAGFDFDATFLPHFQSFLKRKRFKKKFGFERPKNLVIHAQKPMGDTLNYIPTKWEN